MRTRTASSRAGSCSARRPMPGTTSISSACQRWPTGRSRGTFTRPTRRSSSPASSAGPARWPGSSPAISRAAAASRPDGGAPYEGEHSMSDQAAAEAPGSLLMPITLQTAGERIAERIVTAIALGEFVPDQRLPTERELARMLEVSRTTVREALQRLQASRYVTTKRGRGGGTFVRAHSGPDADDMIARTLVPAWADLTELLDFRRLTEQLIARTAAERRDSRDIARLRQAARAYSDATNRDGSRLAGHALRPGGAPGP